jgi:hypothetical protein
MIAHQVAGKAARDGFFLQHFSPSSLPKMVVGGALLSFLLAVFFARISERSGPARIVPGAFALSAALHLAEWFSVGALPRVTSVLIYLHIVGLGAILLSGFWLLLSEVFDLREAKRRFGRVAGFGTAGGVFGGIAAERLAAWGWGDELLLLLGLLHVMCAGISSSLKPPAGHVHRHHEPVTFQKAFSRTPLLWQLALLVFLGTCTAALLDYLFKLGAALEIGRGPALVRYFAIYYTASQVLTFLLQTFVAKSAVEKLGVSKSVASLPVAVGLGSTAALLIPVYPVVVLLRATEMILRGSLFRSGYEFLYTPVPPADKRAVKTIVDVGFDRMGDAVGAGAVQMMIWLGPALARPEILGLAMVLTAISTTVAMRLERSYRGVLERGLVERSREEEAAVHDDDSLVNTFFEGLPSLPQTASVRIPREPKPTAGAMPVPGALPHDPVVERLGELRCGDKARVLRALDPDDPWEVVLVPQVIRLLAWDEVSAAASAFLQRGGRLIIGQIIDSLIDQDLDYNIRRRLPRLLSRVEDQQCVDGLLSGLSDTRFEIRYQCGRALERLRRRHPELDYRTHAILSAAERELHVNQAIWTSRRRIERREGSPDGPDFLDEVLKDRADRSLEHVFSLFAVIYPRDPLMAAFRALHQNDRMFRGLALEYLENVLPEEIRERLWQIIEEAPPAPISPADEKAVLASLVESNAAFVLRLRRPESEAHVPVLPPQPAGDPQPEDGHGDVEPGKAGESH